MSQYGDFNNTDTLILDTATTNLIRNMHNITSLIGHMGNVLGS